MTDYYKLLGVPPQASPEAIRRAFRDRAKGLHPDAHPGLQGAARERMQQQFVHLAQAYETLRDPSKRAAYDRQWRTRYGGRPAAGSPGAGRDGRGAAAADAYARTRSAGAGAQGSGPRRRPGTPPPPEPDLEDLLADLEHLFRQMGLDLRQPVERLLEALVDWARAVYRSALDAWDAGKDQPADPAGEETHSSSTDRAGTGEGHQRQGPRGPAPGSGTARPGTRPRPRTAPDAAYHRATPAELDAELSRLKADVRSGRTRSTPSPEEEELRRIKERLRRAHETR